MILIRDLFSGLEAFLRSTSLVIQSPKLRVWYAKRLAFSAVLAIFTWAFFALTMGFGLWRFMHEMVAITGADLYLNEKWFQTFVVLLWMVILFFISGPATLLMGAFFLSNFGQWRLLEKNLTDAPFLRSDMKENLFRKMIRLVFLLVIVLVATALEIFPPLILVSVPLIALSLGLEWQMTAAEEFGPLPKSKAYLIGVGLVPATLTSLPLISLFLLPLMQVAATLPYLSRPPAKG